MLDTQGLAVFFQNEREEAKISLSMRFLYKIIFFRQLHFGFYPALTARKTRLVQPTIRGEKHPRIEVSPYQQLERCVPTLNTFFLFHQLFNRIFPAYFCLRIAHFNFLF